MVQRAYHLHNGKRGAALAVRVIPRASKNEIAGVLPDGTVRIRLAAPPVEGKANTELTKYLAQILGVPKTSIEIVAGEKGRDKLISVLDLDAQIAQERILAHMG